MSDPVIRFDGAALALGSRRLWSGLDLAVSPGEFIAVLGSNGTGKTSLLRVMLGEQRLSAGAVRVLGQVPSGGDRRIGYIPQQKLLERGTPLRARDLVAFGLDGHRWGLPLPSRSVRAQVDELLDSVGAAHLAEAPVARLSGGEQQRVRIAQAIAGDVRLLLCDEPLLSLDLHRQREISALIDAKRRERGAAVVFVTHDVNPILGMVDRVLYLAGGAFRIGRPEEVLRSDVLSEMYGTPVDVLHTRSGIVVVGAPGGAGEHHVHEEAGA